MFSKEEIALAKPCYGAIKKISKGKWEWEPEVGECFIHKKKIFLVINTKQCGISPFPYFINYYDEEMCLGMKNRQVESRKVIPILPWERIEEILEGMGYYLKLNHYDSDLEDRVLYKGSVFVARFDRNPEREFVPEHEKAGKTRQEAVMKAVIELGKESTYN